MEISTEIVHMPEPVCCDVHEAIYLSLLCASILYFSFITVALSTFFQSFSWVDLVSCIILFLLLCLSGGRLLLLNAGLSKDVYYEARSYEDILIAEKPDLLSTFPFVRKIEDPDHNLNMMNAKNVSVNLHCNTTISLPQCTQIEKFILERISSMGGKPYADLHLTICAPAPLPQAGNRVIFSKTIPVAMQKEIRDPARWAAKAFPAHRWLGVTALMMLAYLLSFTAFCSIDAKNTRQLRRLPVPLFSIVTLLFFGGFYLLNNFHHETLYRHLPVLLIAPWVLLGMGCWSVRYFFRTKLTPRFIALLTQCFTLFSTLSGLLLLIVDYNPD